VAIGTTYSSDVVNVIVVPRMRRSSVVKAMHIIQHRPILIKSQSCDIIKILKIAFRWPSGSLRWVAIGTTYSSDVVDVIFVPQM